MLLLSWPTRRTLIAAAAVLTLGLPGASAAQSTPAPPRRRRIASRSRHGPGPARAGPIRRYDWFERLWRERRSAWAQTVDADRHAVVFLGDSITQGWVEGSAPPSPDQGRKSWYQR